MSADLDFERQRRQGFPEVVYGAGKSAEQLADIARSFGRSGTPLLVTRLDASRQDAVRAVLPPGRVRTEPRARCLSWLPPGYRPRPPAGVVNLVSAGSSDEPVLLEAQETLRFFGVRTRRIEDAGVAGVHRILRRTATLKSGRVNIVVAGMDGALPSVVGGLVGRPVIAVPTSVGYGASFQGLAALLAMLNSCASGLTVVNIDNGYGAAMAALRILRAGDASPRRKGARRNPGRA